MSPWCTVVSGRNGAGKTTILEAVSILCTTRSFVIRQDRSILRKGAEAFFVEGEFMSGSGARKHVSVEYPGVQGRKRILVDYAALETTSDLIGQFPIVTLSPQHRPITAGGPVERRAFLDFVISQVHHSYLLDLLEYRRLLRQRNALLSEHHGSVSSLRPVLDPWDLAIAESAVRIIRRRMEFIDTFQPFFQRTMSEVIGDREIVSLRYGYAHRPEQSQDDPVAAYLESLRQRLEHDVRRKTTTMGPHRDELEMYLNDLEVRAQASQGQHKTVLISLKIAEFHYLNQRLDEVPILLLDDVFSELDDDRLDRVLQLVRGIGQTFITTANRAMLEFFPRTDSENRTFRIEQGKVLALAEVA